MAELTHSVGATVLFEHLHCDCCCVIIFVRQTVRDTLCTCHVVIKMYVNLNFTTGFPIFAFE